ncbi:hypothetical protein ITP53_34070, partial [Nonomuraea sp. K274]|nr:hypothetical protein [Nonomuraea cypriaca]
TSGPQQQSQDRTATPANPTLQFGQPTYGQSAYGQPAPPTPPWGGTQTPAPGYGPPPKQSNPMPWVFGGLAALVVVVLIAVAGIYLLNRGTTESALPPAPSDTFLPPQDPPGNQPPPQQSGGELPEPANGQVTDPRTGITFTVPEGWTVPAYDEINGQNPAQQLWSSAVQATSHEDYQRQLDWVGNVFTGLLNDRYPYSGADGMGDTAKAVFTDFSRQYYEPAHESKIVEDKSMKIGDHDAWLLQFELDFTKVSEENDYKWKKESGAIVLMDRGSGETPAIVYVSVPDNLGTDVVGQVLGSLKSS